MDILGVGFAVCLVAMPFLALWAQAIKDKNDDADEIRETTDAPIGQQ